MYVNLAIQSASTRQLAAIPERRKTTQLARGSSDTVCEASKEPLCLTLFVFCEPLVPVWFLCGQRQTLFDEKHTELSIADNL